MSDTPAAYFRTFFSEKSLPVRSWEIVHGHDVHLISSADVIELLTQLPDDSGSREIRRVITMIDFANNTPELYNYLEFLATAYIRTNFPTTI